MLYHGYRFPAVVIRCPVLWCFRFSLSLRGIHELLPEHGVVITYETIRYIDNGNDSSTSDNDGELN